MQATRIPFQLRFGANHPTCLAGGRSARHLPEGFFPAVLVLVRNTETEMHEKA